MKRLGLDSFVTDPYDQQAMQCMEQPNSTPDTPVAGMATLKEELNASIRLPLAHVSLFFGTETARHLVPCQTHILCGPPGTGKTLLVRHIAADAGVVLFNVSLASIEDKYFGESPKLLRALFRTAKQHAPCIIFIDEIDGIGRARHSDESSATYGMKTELLRHMDDVASCGLPVFVIACTNHESAMDSALLRRFGKIHHIPLPDSDDRREIVHAFTRQEKMSDDLVEAITTDTVGRSGSYIKDRYKDACAKRLARFVSERDESEISKLAPSALASQIGPLTYSDWSIQDGAHTSVRHAVADGADVCDSEVSDLLDEAPPPEQA